MRTITHTRDRRSAQGFTLVELLTVVMIIMLLVGILLPSLMGARIAVMRERCKHNCKEIAKASIAYATESSNHRGYSAVPPAGTLPCLANALPNTMLGATANWSKGSCTSTTMPEGNIGAFWMLYKMNYLGPEHIFCLESEQQRETRQINETDTLGFKGIVPDNTACYSYLAQAWNSSESGSTVVKYGVSMIDTPAYVILVADWNPGVTCNGAAAGSTDNSLNHKKEGQNFARIDGSAEWTEKRAIFVKIVNGLTLEDDIYVNKGSSSAAGPRQEYNYNGVLLPATDDFLLH